MRQRSGRGAAKKARFFIVDRTIQRVGDTDVSDNGNDDSGGDRLRRQQQLPTHSSQRLRVGRRSYFIKKRCERNDSLVTISKHDRRAASRLSSFGVILFHWLLGNFSGMFWGSPETRMAVSNRRRTRRPAYRQLDRQIYVKLVGCCIDREAIAETVSVSSRSFCPASIALIDTVCAFSLTQGQ